MMFKNAIFVYCSIVALMDEFCLLATRLCCLSNLPVTLLGFLVRNPGWMCLVRPRFHLYMTCGCAALYSAARHAGAKAWDSFACRGLSITGWIPSCLRSSMECSQVGRMRAGDVMTWDMAHHPWAGPGPGHAPTRQRTLSQSYAAIDPAQCSGISATAKY